MIIRAVTIWVFLLAAVSLRAALPYSKSAQSPGTQQMERKVVSLYLVRGYRDAYDARAGDLANLPLEAEPLFTSADMTGYDVATCKFALKKEALKRLRSTEVPMAGRPFVVMVGDRRVYFGAFWSIISSLSWDGIAIGHTGSRLEISRAPSDKPDPRFDPEMLEILKSVGNMPSKVASSTSGRPRYFLPPFFFAGFYQHR